MYKPNFLTISIGLSSILAAAGLQRREIFHEFAITPVYFSKFLINANINLKTNYIFRKPMNRRFQRYIVQTEILSYFLK